SADFPPDESGLQLPIGPGLVYGLANSSKTVCSDIAADWKVRAPAAEPDHPKGAFQMRPIPAFGHSTLCTPHSPLRTPPSDLNEAPLRLTLRVRPPKSIGFMRLLTTLRLPACYVHAPRGPALRLLRTRAMRPLPAPDPRVVSECARPG